MSSIDTGISRRSLLMAVIALGAAGIAPSSPKAAYATNPENVDDVLYLSNVHISAEAESRINKIASIGDTFYFDASHRLATSATPSELTSVYGFTESDVQFLEASVLGRYVSDGEWNDAAPLLHLDGSRVYISHDDLTIGSFAAVALAANAGPAALSAAITAAASVIGGPVGTALGTIIGFLGGASLATLCGMIVWAVANGKGIYIGLTPQFPPIEMGYW